MKTAVRLLMLTSLTLPFVAHAQSANRCDAVFVLGSPNSPRPVTIDELLKNHNAAISNLGESFRLQLKALYQMIELNYGPLVLKGPSLGVEWSQMKDDTMKSAGKISNTNDEAFAISDLLFKFDDAHVSVELPSSLIFNLPLQIRAAEGQFLVQAVSPKFPAGVRAPEQGDEIVSINGQAPAEFRKRFAEWNAVGNDLTAQSIFGLGFPAWREARGLNLSQVKEGGVVLKIRSKANGETYDVTLDFQKEGAGMIGKGRGDATHPEIIASEKSSIDSGTRALRSQAPNSASVLESFNSLFRAEVKRGPRLVKDEDSWKMNIGQQQPSFKLPEDFKKIEFLPALAQLPFIGDFLTTSDHVAGTFMHNGKRVGFLRIPSYSPENLNAAVITLRYLVARLQAESDYLVIDQQNNPGGYVVYSDMLIKALNGNFNQAKHLRFAVKPTQNFLRQFLEMRNEVKQNKDGLLTDYEASQFAAQLDVEYGKIYKAYTEGKNLSEPVSMLVMSEYYERTLNKILANQSVKGMTMGKALSALLGVDIRQNNQYTKPVYFMINELDFSGGDATPASLKSYGRVTLIGTRTAGAGGTVEEFVLRGHTEMKIHLTTSLMVLPDGTLVENYGVTPHINLPLQASDVKDGYSTIFSRFMGTIDQHLSQQPQTQTPTMVQPSAGFGPAFRVRIPQ